MILAQEIQNPAAATAFLNVLNSAGGSDWVASYRALTCTGATNDQVVFYRKSKTTILGEPTLDNPAFRYLHTQDPTGNGGMDDRHDQILLSGSLVDGMGLDYVGRFGTAYSTSTWNDPNHSHRAWGNDGTTFDQAMRIGGNSMVGASIAQSLANLATLATLANLANLATDDGGHLPVFLDLRYQTVPEPATFVALGARALAVLLRRKR